MLRVRWGILAVLPISMALAYGCSGDDASELGEEPDAGKKDGAPITPADAGSQADTTPQDSGPPLPDIDTFAWSGIGTGIAFKDTTNPNGKNALVAYAGYTITLDSAKAWVSELYRSYFQSHGVRYVVAVQGPKDAAYNGLEISNTKLGEKLVPLIDGTTKFVAIVAHSSGCFVAHEFMNQLIVTTDPDGKLSDKVVYFNLDGAVGSGDYKGFSKTTATYVNSVWFVGAQDGTTKSPNYAAMQAAGTSFSQYGGFLAIDTTGAGCTAAGCVHTTCVTSKPHAPGAPNVAQSNMDYSDFSGRPVMKKYLDMKQQLF